MRANRRHTAVAAGLAWLGLHANLQACAVCFAAPESPESRGMTIAILFLLGTIGTVLCGIGAFFIYLLAKQKEPLPPHAEISQQPAL